jgi:membrane protein required for beta-lactamase induction
MALIVVLVVYAAEYYFRFGVNYRSFTWFRSIQQKLAGHFDEQTFWQGWGGVALILLTPIVILWLLLNLFNDGLKDLILFVISCVVLFISIGPKTLWQSFEQYFNAVERGDQEAAFLSLQNESAYDDLPESDDFIRNATRVIFVESQSRYFGVLFWFVLTGPLGALFYRLAHQYQKDCKQSLNDEHLEILHQLIHWLDWLPVRLTSFLLLLTGDFVKGFYRVKDYWFDLEANNYQIISETGVAALGIDAGMPSNQTNENKQALFLIERTMIIYLVVVAIFTPLALW